MRILYCLKWTLLTLLTCCAQFAHAEEPKPTDLAPLSSVKLDPKTIGDEYKAEGGIVIDDFSGINKLPKQQRADAEKLKRDFTPIGVAGLAEYSLVRTSKFPLNTVVVRVYVFKSDEKRKAWCDKKYGYDGWENHYRVVETDREGMTILESTETPKRIIHFGRVWITTHQLHKGDEHLKAAESVLEQLKARGKQPAEVSQNVLGNSLGTQSTPGTMLHDHLLTKAEAHFAAWQQAYDQRKTPEQIAQYQRSLREKFVEAIGGFPERTPLNAKITGRVARDNFSVEKILFESEPGFYVTGAMFLPDPEKFPPPWPGVLVVCGHTPEGKAYDPYQRATALLALNGIAGFIVDPVCQGERSQLLSDEGKPLDRSSTIGHTLVGTGAILVGRNTARYEIWDTMRALDYLESRDDIRADALGCMGNSGGGTQTAYLMALDDRVKAAAPCCYIVGFETLLKTIGPQDAEQNIFGQLAFGMDHADYFMMRAPRPTLLCAATEDFFDIEGVWKTFRKAKRLYTRLGASEHVDIIEFDGPHGWSQPLREASVEFMLRHLKGELKQVSEPDIKVLSAEEIQVTPEGQVLKLEGARSAFDLNVEESQRLARKRAERELNPEQLRQEVRKAVGVKSWEELGDHQVKNHAEQPTFKSQGEPVVLTWDDGIHLPGLLTKSDATDESEQPPVLYLHSSGMASATAADGPARALAREGRTVLALDVRGIGETTPDAKTWYDSRFGKTGGAAMIAYLMGESLVGRQTEDILVATRYLMEQTGADQVDLVATDQLTIPALHAAALEPERFGKVRLEQGLVSWTNVVETPQSKNQIPGVVHGALRVYDLPDLRRLMGEGVKVVEPRAATGKELAPGDSAS